MIWWNETRRLCTKGRPICPDTEFATHYVPNNSGRGSGALPSHPQVAVHADPVFNVGAVHVSSAGHSTPVGPGPLDFDWTGAAQFFARVLI